MKKALKHLKVAALFAIAIALLAGSAIPAYANASSAWIIGQGKSNELSAEEAVAYEQFLETVKNGSTGDFIPVAEDETVSANTAENAVTIEVDTSPQAVYNALIAMKSRYPEGMHYTNADYYFWLYDHCHCYGCAAFVGIMSDAAFGDLPVRTYNGFYWDELRVGDVLRVSHGAHSVIILEKHSDYVVVAEGNYNSSIHWGRPITKSELASEMTYYKTRYPKGSPDQPGTDPTPTNPTDNPSNTASFSVTNVRTGVTETFNSANGKCKILMFGGIGSCGNTTATMRNASNVCKSMGLKSTEIWAFDIIGNSDSVMKNACENYSVGSDVKVISAYEDDKWYGMYYDLLDFADEVGLLDDGTLYMPLTVLVDGNGKILAMDVSRLDTSDIAYMIDASGIKKSDNDNSSKLSAVNAFVDRLYTVALKRSYDASGMNYWSDELISGKQTGAQVASGFFLGEEMKLRGISDEEYVKTLYAVMMDRVPDQSGLNYWTGLMDNGYSRAGVFREFVGSEEFGLICNSYGITPGSYDVTGAGRNPGLSAFMSRLYTKAMGRPYDVSGLDYWCEEIYQGHYTLMQVCTDQFFHSEEFRLKNLNDVEYVKVLYRTFFGREYDEEGLNYWLAQMMYFGKDRDFILNEFALSQEFAQIKAQYGL